MITWQELLELLFPKSSIEDYRLNAESKTSLRFDQDAVAMMRFSLQLQLLS